MVIGLFGSAIVSVPPTPWAWARESAKPGANDRPAVPRAACSNWRRSTFPFSIGVPPFVPDSARSDQCRDVLGSGMLHHRDVYDDVAEVVEPRSRSRRHHASAVVFLHDARSGMRCRQV